jgi:uncharacterized membrane protein YeaQ/YmgE (transglycosylase-associated protein family)
MVLLLNLLTGVFGLLVGVYLYYTYKNTTLTSENKLKRFVTALVISLVCFWAYGTVHPSYVPKGKVDRLAVPEFEVIEGKIVDIQPKPMSGEDRDIKRKEAYKEVLPFKEANKDLTTPK